MLGIASKLNTKGKTSWRTLGAKIYIDMKENPDTYFVQAEASPVGFYLRDLWGGKAIDTEIDGMISELTLKIRILNKAYQAVGKHPLYHVNSGFDVIDGMINGVYLKFHYVNYRKSYVFTNIIILLLMHEFKLY